MKLGIGTVQFGCDYGISNKNGQTKLADIEKILQFALEHNIDVIDTAQAYGTSESVLGNFDLSKFKVVTKVLENGSLYDSLEKLKLDKVYALLLHHEGLINDNSWKVLQKYKSENLVKKIGISVYSPKVLNNIIDNYNIDIVQIPFNILDQRFTDILPKLKEKNIEVHSRSTFLQGLLLMDTKDINPYFNEIVGLLKRLPTDKLHTAIQFVKNNKYIDKMIVGTTNVKEFQEIYDNYLKNDVHINYSEFRLDDEKYVNPSNWRLI